jgi:protein-tyrosine phosphatase
MRILFVCMGNICRSPTAEATLRRLLREQGLEDRVEVDSAGTGNWHVGEPPDERAAAAARRRQLELDGQARQLRREDFRAFDLIVAMDARNRREVLQLAPDDAARAKVRLLREFDPAARAGGDLDVPDPYFGGDQGFEHVLDLVDAGTRGLLESLRADGRV